MKLFCKLCCDEGGEVLFSNSFLLTRPVVAARIGYGSFFLSDLRETSEWDLSLEQTG